MGLIKGIKHEIKLNRAFNPSFKEYSVPIHIKGEVESHLEELMKLDLITKKKVDIASPAFPIRKKNNKIRLVIDYRELNKINIPMEIKFPTIAEILQSLCGSKVFSSIDLNSVYYQILMETEDIDKTAFRLLGNTYVFKRMLFGLSNAPMTLTKAIKAILKDLPFVKVYMDDILIHSPTFEEHHRHLDVILNRLIAHGASVNFEKSVFGQS
ncbi:Transposon Ty3-I Gag-Pol polyprotein [Dictyocoela muelleri]|nr:Transposon Ty3-I Gag-Pol polyprotein [Dictyocoela muelleri]